MQISIEENTSAQVELENHVVSEEHKKAGAKLAALTSFPHGGAAEKGKGRGRLKLFRKLQIDHVYFK